MRMGRFSIPNVFSKLWQAVKPAVSRFPALFVLGIAAAVAVALDASAYDLFRAVGEDTRIAERAAFMLRAKQIAEGCALGMLLAVAVQLLLERRRGRRTQFVCQAVIAVLSLAAFPPLIAHIDEAHIYVLLGGMALALAAVILFLLACEQGTDITAANCVVSAVIAGISSLCAFLGLLNVCLAFIKLVFTPPRAAESIAQWLCVAIPFCALSPGIFVAFAARKRGEISFSVAYRTVVLRILFPLGIALLFVLYVYLAKCLFTLTMPVGKINPFVSIATAFYLFFYFCSLPLEGRLLSLFRKYGALLMLPLIAAQIASFAIRVSAYGYTQARVASLLYIAFSLAACALTFVRSGAWTHLSFLVLAAACLVGSVTPLNIVDVADWSQVARIVRVYRAHGLLSDGVPVAEGAKDALSAEEMLSVYGSWLGLSRKNARLPTWARADGTDFEKTFGFSREMARSGASPDLWFDLGGTDAVIDVSAYSHLRHFTYTEHGIEGEVAITLAIDGETFDISDTVRPLMSPKRNGDDSASHEPLVIAVGGGRTLVLTSAHVHEPYSKSGERQGKGFYSVEGYLCW